MRPSVDHVEGRYGRKAFAANLIRLKWVKGSQMDATVGDELVVTGRDARGAHHGDPRDL
jgi:hypothetical protein